MRLSLLVAATLAACANAGGSAQTDASHDTGGAIDAAPDAFACSQMPCSILPQCGCSQTFACDVDTSDANGTACRPVTAPGTHTTECNSLDDCDKGFVCLGNAQYGSCKKYCTTDADCGTPRGKCVLDISSGGTPVPGIPAACSSNCDPTDTTGALCPSTYKCGLFNATHAGSPVKITDCSPAGAGTQGADCKQGTVGNDALCAKGFLCTTTDNNVTFKCRKVCKSPAATSAACGGQQCIGFADPFTVGGDTYGVCAP
jgi:hypothetical protein